MLGKSGTGSPASSLHSAAASPLGLAGLSGLLAAGVHTAGSLLGTGGFSSQSLCALLLVCSSVLLGLVHQPWKSIGRALDVRFAVRTAFTGLLLALQLSLYLAGLQRLGPLRTLLVADSAAHVYRAVYATLSRGQQLFGARLRGLLAVLLAYALLCLFDSSLSEPDGLLSGFALLVASTLVAVLKKNMLLALCADQSDESRLHSLATPAAALFAAAALVVSPSSLLLGDEPAALASAAATADVLGDASSAAAGGVAAAAAAASSLLGLVFCAYALLSVPHTIASTLSAGRLAAQTAHYACSIGSFAALLLLDWSLDAGASTPLLLVEIGLAVVGVHWLIGADGGADPRHDAKKSEGFLPAFAESAHGASSGSVLAAARNVLAQILSNPDSRSIFVFLTINLMFMFVEMAYGYWTNSLGLISDAFHMLTDCSALAIGLYAAVIAKWEPTPEFSYGYARVQTLAGFANAIFLVFISFSVLTEGLARLIDPPQVKPEELFVVSCMGLGVNLIGMFAFSGHGHVHGHGGHSDDDDDESGHHGHSHGDANMSGVFLHVLADTLGSVGVIISSVLIWAFDWQRSDPLCSLILSVLIFVSVMPLLKSSISTLLHKTPGFVVKQLPRVRAEIEAIPGVQKIAAHHFWRYEADHFVGSVSVDIAPGADAQAIRAQVSRSLSQIIDVRNCTVQLKTSKLR